MENKEKGWQQINYQSKELPSGLYYFMLQTEQHLISKKIIIADF